MTRRSGMMWQWDPKTDIQKAAMEAIAHYKRTRGCKPGICYTNDKFPPQEVAGVPICPLPSITPFHLWLLKERIDGEMGNGNKEQTERKTGGNPDGI